MLKKFLFIFIFIILVISLSACSENKNEELILDPERIEVIYFYSNQRCSFCKNMDEFLEKAFSQIKRDDLEFRKINYDKIENSEIVEKFSARNLGLYFNLITKEKNIIEEDVNVWRFLNNQEEFTSYLQEKIKSLLDN